MDRKTAMKLLGINTDASVKLIKERIKSLEGQDLTEEQKTALEYLKKHKASYTELHGYERFAQFVYYYRIAFIAVIVFIVAAVIFTIAQEAKNQPDYSLRVMLAGDFSQADAEGLNDKIKAGLSKDQNNGYSVTPFYEGVAQSAPELRISMAMMYGSHDIVIFDSYALSWMFTNVDEPSMMTDVCNYSKYFDEDEIFWAIDKSTGTWYPVGLYVREGLFEKDYKYGDIVAIVAPRTAKGLTEDILTTLNALRK